MQLTNEYNVPQYIPQVTLAQHTSTSHCTRITSSSIAAAPRCTRLPSLQVYYPTHAYNIHAIGSSTIQVHLPAPLPNSSNKSLSEHLAASTYRCTCQTPLPTHFIGAPAQTERTEKKKKSMLYTSPSFPVFEANAKKEPFVLCL